MNRGNQLMRYPSDFCVGVLIESVMYLVGSVSLNAFLSSDYYSSRHLYLYPSTITIIMQFTNKYSGWDREKWSCLAASYTAKED